jgi:hypothetical protein
MATETDKAIISRIKSQITYHQRRLSILKEKQAVMGMSADPSVGIEIEDTEETIKKLQCQLAQLELKGFPTSLVDEQSSPKRVDTDHWAFQGTQMSEENTL